MVPSTEEEAIQLTTTLMPLPTKCKKLRRLTDTIQTWWMRTSPWRKDLLSTQGSDPSIAPSSLIINIPNAIVLRASALQRGHDARMRRDSEGLCRTKPLTMDTANRLVEGTGVVLTTQLTCGGMSRIFQTQTPGILVKISDLSRGWSRYEPQGYKLLEDHDLPTAKIKFAICRQGFMVIGVERLHCTMASVIKMVAMDSALYLDQIARGLQSLVRALRHARVTFGDLSPDNIMCRQVDDTKVELVLIDPQFATSTKSLEGKMGKQWARAFDNVHLALKIQAMGHISKDVSIKRAANALCCALLSRWRPPSTQHMIHWLLHDVPLILRMAYMALQKKHGEKNVATLYAPQNQGSNQEEEHQHQQVPVGTEPPPRQEQDGGEETIRGQQQDAPSA